MEIGTTFQNNRISGNATPQAAQGGTAISSDFETFIKMLTVQMQNQDPLNPVESSDFAVQLATFSTVEQQVLTNDLLTTLGTQIAAQSVAQLSGWVGMDARAEMPVEFTGNPVKLSLPESDLADTVHLVVQNNQGIEIQRLDVSTHQGELSWSGIDDFGAILPSGTYNISAEFFSQGEVIASEPVEVHARIVEARNDGGQPVLVMSTGQQVSASEILGLRQADA